MNSLGSDLIPAGSPGLSITKPLKTKFDHHLLDIRQKKPFPHFFGGDISVFFRGILDYNLDIRCELEREIFHDGKVRKISKNDSHIYSIT